MAPRRNKFELFVDILAAINAGCSKPTKIMHYANLSWKPMGKMLDNLLEQELIQQLEKSEKDKRVKALYGITPKGLNVLRYYRRAVNCIDPLIRRR